MKNSFEIVNQVDDTTELRIYGIIGSYWDNLSADDIVTQIEAVKSKNLIVRIYSDGGSVFAGLSIYSALKRSKANVIIEVDSLAASIASVIAMAGTVRMPINSMMMIHNPSTGIYGDEDELRKTADLLSKIKTMLVNVYKEKTKLDEDKISQLLTEETWMNAQEAKELGFADELIGSVDVQNRFDGNWHQKLTNKVGDEKKMDIETLKKDFPDIANALIEEGKKLEHTRIKEVKGMSLSGHEALIETLMFDGKTTGGEAAQAIIHAEAKIRTSIQAALVSDPLTPLTPITGQTIKPVSQPETWEHSESLRNEFCNDKAAYDAYMEATKKGAVKTMGGNK